MSVVQIAVFGEHWSGTKPRRRYQGRQTSENIRFFGLLHQLGVQSNREQKSGSGGRSAVQGGGGLGVKRSNSARAGSASFTTPPDLEAGMLPPRLRPSKSNRRLETAITVVGPASSCSNHCHARVKSCSLVESGTISGLLRRTASSWWDVQSEPDPP